MRRRTRVLVGAVLVTGLFTAALLWSVVTTVFFAITVAYVLYPLRCRLMDRGLTRRLAAAASTSVAFVTVFALLAPVVWSLYRRRGTLLSYLRSFPEFLEFEVLGMPVAFELGTVVATVRSTLTAFAVDVARAAPILALKVFLFTLLVYALLLRPGSATRVVYETIPRPYHDLVRTLHERVRDVLYAIYLLQGATALGTFVIAYVVFAGFGYPGAFGLAAIAGILQFVPVVGPSILIVVIAATDLLAGNTAAALALLGVGLVFVGFLPDALIRPQLAPYTADIPASLYFIGFTGGVLTIGIVGFIAGPLVIALFVEAVELLVAEQTPVQQRLDDDAGGGTGE